MAYGHFEFEGTDVFGSELSSKVIYSPTQAQVAGKFVAEFCGQYRRFGRVSSLDAKIALLDLL